MRRLGSIALIAALAVGSAIAQQAGVSLSPAQADGQPERVKVYAAGLGVTAPELLPLIFSPAAGENCGPRAKGKVEISFLVDTAGQARNIMFVRPLGTDLDIIALRVAAEDRFKPGTLNGKAVVVAESAKIRIEACLVQTKNAAGKTAYHWRPTSAPQQELGAFRNPPHEAVLAPVDGVGGTVRVGGDVSRPVSLDEDGPQQAEEGFVDEARALGISGTCSISLIVDSHGMPQDVKVIKPLDPRLDRNAVNAVNRFRFKPAMRDGEPVAVGIEVELNTRIDYLRD